MISRLSSALFHCAISLYWLSKCWADKFLSIGLKKYTKILYVTHSGLLWSWPFKCFPVHFLGDFFLSGNVCLESSVLLAAQNSLALLTYLPLLEAFKTIFFQSFFVLFDRKFRADYFHAKIRKNERVKKPVEGFKVKSPSF